MPRYVFGSDVLLPYLRETSIDRKLHTQKTETLSCKYLEPFFGRMVLTHNDKEPKRITGSVVRQFRETLKLTRGMKPTSVKRHLAVASKAVNYAISEWDFECPNPFQKRLISERDAIAARSEPHVWRELTDAQEARLLLACEPFCRDVVLFSLNTGLRQSETLSLTWDRVCGDVIKFTPDTQKANRYGERIMNQTALEIVARQQFNGPFVFHDQNGKPVSRFKLNHLWRQAREAAGLPGFQFHWLRKNAGQRILNVPGASIEEVQHQLGHSDVRTTQSCYTKAPVDRMRHAVSAIG